ncbi:heavy metal translocating P-type ATPase [Shouchella lonarensis]|uniref:Cd(2+)-exporting ATPase n=1 Tax=Shouchella lonarensis TaxID=1464122 RepID=A0A1G6JIF5_9BACI|nr:heavy metal translocating P-type ATPase [Shouchella lonarensis]SDC18572.1 Cd2+/Zn2+-exporting ATPase [Shouchella lonarensis]
MGESLAREDKKEIYRVKGFSCPGCAETFEKNVKRLDGVQDAKVNFTAEKITVYGTTTIAALEKAGAFEKLVVKVDEEAGHAAEDVKSTSLIERYGHILMASFLVVAGLILPLYTGAHWLFTILPFALAMIIGGYTLFITGFMNLLHARFDMKTLMTIAVIGAAILGEWVEGAIIVVLFAVGEALERFSMDRARQSIRSLMGKTPKTATVKRDGHEVSVKVEDVTIGEMMIVKPGEKIALDGTVVTGHSTVNQAAITGESLPVEKKVTDQVYAGTLNEEGWLEIEVTKHVADTTIAKVIKLVEEAQAARAPAQAFVDRFAKYYTPAIIIVALLVMIIPPLLLGASWTVWVYQGLAVLVVGCPCALVISTPVAIVTAIGNAAKHGVLIKGGAYLEALGSMKVVAFDKTGTLTAGVPAVTDVRMHGVFDRGEALACLAALESRSQHPLASAVLKQISAEGIAFQQLEVDDFSSMTGKGICGVIDGITYYACRPAFFQSRLKEVENASLQAEITTFQRQGKSVIVFGTDRDLIAVLAIADQVREESKHVVSKLQQLGVKKTVMLTGDHETTAQALAQMVGITEVRASLMPEDKLDAVKSYREEHGKVAMVGDGVNDAPALAAATVGVAMGGAGVDTALETADVALMSDDLKKLPYAMKLSRRALAIIKQNISFALGLKLFALLLVIPGWLTLWVAILSDVGATLLVILNSLRLLKVKD